jgi:hypothetical protein
MAYCMLCLVDQQANISISNLKGSAKYCYRKEHCTLDHCMHNYLTHRFFRFSAKKR